MNAHYLGIKNQLTHSSRFLTMSFLVFGFALLFKMEEKKN